MVPDSGRAFTSMVTPEGGMVEMTDTRNEKGPAEGVSVDPVAGVVVTESTASDLQGSAAGFLLQNGVKSKVSATSERKGKFLLMNSFLM